MLQVVQVVELGKHQIRLVVEEQLDWMLHFDVELLWLQLLLLLRY